MREIKFRAWTKAKKMVYDVVPFQWDYCINRMWHKCIETNGKGILGSGGTEAKFEVGGYSIVDGSLMQYTGLKDKNGKEIYEGDIDKKGRVVKYSGSSFRLYQGEQSVDYLEWICEEITIIGNIHETPELLNK
jgi:uncharacterized phage protein (TIGR01671 family)